MSALEHAARRMMWWKTPGEALANRRRLLAQIMAYGALADVQVMLAEYGQEAFLGTLLDAPPGVFDLRSWRYWHLYFRLPVPPLPARRLDAKHPETKQG
ncbi:MAG: hypothetical protein ACYDB9_12355 [Gammaproteobacteria bacterium]